MDDRKRFEKLLYTARQTALYVLDELGVLFPMGLTISADGQDVTSYYPRDEFPDADWPQLLTASDANLRQQIEQGDVGGVALVTPLENDGMTGVGIQVENEQVSCLLIYPYKREDDHFVLDEPLNAEDLLVPRLYEPKG